MEREAGQSIPTRSALCYYLNIEGVMTHYVIIGNGVAGVEAAMTIRRRHSPGEARITLISDEAPYFFSRTALMYAYMGRLDRRDMEPFERAVYQRQQIERVQDRVIDLDAQARRITLLSGEKLTFDRLLIACGASPRMENFSGLEEVEEGLVHFVSLQDLNHCERLTWSTKQAAVVGGGLIGLELVECFLHHGLEVLFLVREPYFWPAALGRQEGEMVADHLRQAGVDLRFDEALTQIEVDDLGRVSALHTSKEERHPCQLLGICIGVEPNIGWLKEVTTPPELGLGLKVNPRFETSLENVYGAGDCAEIHLGPGQPPLVETIWYSAKRQGRLAALNMLGDDEDYQRPLFFNSAKFMGIEFTTAGDMQDLPPGSGALYRRLEGKNISQRIAFSETGQVLGFNMLGSRWDHTLLLQWIRERRSIEFVRENLHRAQFDVEFGRAKLGAMIEVEESL